MSFNVNWNSLETDSLRSWTVELLTEALNSGKRPNILASDITIKDLNFGKIAPRFEILEIGELDRDRFRGIFKIDYNGDFHLTLHTKVQANPLKIYSDNSLEKEILASSPFVTPDFLLSLDAFNIPLDLKLSDIKISGIGIIVFSKSKGLTMVFRNDPLDSIKVSSTFDTVQVLATFLQNQIENQIRDLFRETLPTLLHKVSLKYTSSNNTNDIIDNLKDHLSNNVYLNALESLEVENVSPGNLQKLAKIYSSRETLKLNVPKLKRIVQRNHLEKFNKNLNPNLASCLYTNMGLQEYSGFSGVSSSYNSIPVGLIANEDFKKVDEILQEISSIQSKNFKSGSNDHKPAKRRTIKLGKGMRQKKVDMQNVDESTLNSINMSRCATEYCDTLSDVSTVLSDDQHNHIEQPTPLKVFTDTRPPLRNVVYTEGYKCSSPMNSNSSFVGSVGLGNNFFQIASGCAPSASPLRNDLSGQKSVHSHDVKVKVKKSMNRIDVSQINEKLNGGFNNGTLKEAMHNENKAFSHNDPLITPFELPPPPYHQLSRA